MYYMCTQKTNWKKESGLLFLSLKSRSYERIPQQTKLRCILFWEMRTIVYYMGGVYAIVFSEF